MKSDHTILGLTQNVNYDVLAFDSDKNYLVKTDIGNYKWIPTIYFEQGHINRKVLENTDNFTKENVNEYKYFYLPLKWTFKNRTNSITPKWSIELKTLTDKIGFAHSLMINNQDIGPELNSLMKDDEMRYNLLKERINQIGTIQYFLSDGYNPAWMNLDKIFGENLSDKDIVAIKYSEKLEYNFQELNIEYIRADQISEKIKEAFKWNLEHLICFNNCKYLFATDFHFDIYKEILREIEQDLITYAFINNCTVSLYKQFGTWGHRFLLLKTDKFKTVLELSNEIH